MSSLQSDYAVGVAGSFPSLRGVPCGAKLPLDPAVALILLSLSLLSLVSIVKSFTCRKLHHAYVFHLRKKSMWRKRFLYSNFTRLDALSTLPTTLLSRFYKQLGRPRNALPPLCGQPPSLWTAPPSFTASSRLSSGHRAPTSQTALAPRQPALSSSSISGSSANRSGDSSNVSQ